jgi:hypothetical protein
MTEQTQETTYTAHDHSTIINEAGVMFIGYPNGWGTRFEARAAIAHAEYILAHKDELEQLQLKLEQTWCDVAQEVKERFEADNEDGEPFSEATAQDIQRVLEAVSGTDKRGYFTGEPVSPAGCWYRSMWNEEGSDSTTYEQQWTPFLRTCYELQAQADEENAEAPYDDRTAPHDTDRFRYE